MNIDWELLVKVIGVVGGVLMATLQLRNRIPKSRTTLKHDLEILKLLEKDDPDYAVIKRTIDDRVAEIYGPRRSSSIRIYSWGDFVGGAIFCFGFSSWTLYLLRDGFNWWAFLTALLALGGIGGILTGLEDQQGKGAKRDVQPVRIDTTRRVVLNPLFKKPGPARGGSKRGSIYMGNACCGTGWAWRAGDARRVMRHKRSRSIRVANAS